MNKIDLNCDLGESYGTFVVGADDKVIPYITSANIACGYHASDPIVMQKTVELCKKYGVSAGAHPGYPDLMGFGRRYMDVSPAEAKAYIIYQLGALKAFTDALSIPLCHIKLHGALYNAAGKDEVLAQAIAEVVYKFSPDAILLGLSGSKMEDAAKKIGLRFAREVFADRAYEDDGSLVKRGTPGAIITDEDEAIKRVIGIVKYGKVKTLSGKEINLSADSVCVHGDSAKALRFVEKISAALKDSGIALKPLNEIV